MKKLIIIAIIISSTLFMFGCSVSKEGNQESNSSNRDTDLGTNDTNQKSKNITTNKTDKKEYYIKKLNDIQAKIDKDYNFKDTITTQDMRNASGAQYRLWDDALNEIYNDLKNTLSPDNMEKLKQEELAWISKKESDAKNEADKVKGGTLEPVNYSLSLADSTKKRCYELVNKYMD